MKYFKKTRVMIGGVLLFGASLASAGPVTWQLSNVTFDDGTSATGTLSYDATTDTLLSYSIAVQDGALPAFIYTAANSANTCPKVAFGNTVCDTNDAPNEVFLGSSDGMHFLELYLFSALTDARGTVPLLTSGNIQSYETGMSNGDYNWRIVTSGSLTAVPEPASMTLLGVALAGMFGAARLRKQRKQ